MKRTIRFVTLFCIVLWTAAAYGQSLPRGMEKVTSVEGISEYKLANGLRVLVFPDPSKSTITVNMTYLVGSLQEGSGERGMAPHPKGDIRLALTPQQIQDALRRHLDVASMSIVKAGDFKKAASGK